MKIKKCIVCKKEFTVHNYREKTAKYCSQICMGKDENANWGKTRYKDGHEPFIKKKIFKGKCHFCNNIFIKRKQKNIYCSRKCYWDDLEIRFERDEHPSKGKPNLKMRGKNHPNWNGGSSGLRKSIDSCYKGIKWREDVFKRDNWTCQDCKQIGGKLQAHHIKALNEIIKENNITTIEEALECEKLWNLNNGKTLCRKCHRKTDNYGYPKRKK